MYTITCHTEKRKSKRNGGLFQKYIPTKSKSKSVTMQSVQIMTETEISALRIFFLQIKLSSKALIIMLNTNKI
jgi:hypothetical protein